MIVEGRMQYVFDEAERRYLDAIELKRAAEKCATPQFELSSGHLDNYTKPVHTRIV